MRFIKSIAVMFGASTAVATPLDYAGQKKQLESMIDATLPFAEQMLAKHGEFIPFGATMAPDGKESMIGGDVGKQHPPSREVMDLLRQSYQRDGAAGKIVCCALAYDVRVIKPGTEEKTDAVAIDLDHRDGMSITVYYPYTIDAEKKVVIGECWASKGDGAIFKQQKKGEPDGTDNSGASPLRV